LKPVKKQKKEEEEEGCEGGPGHWWWKGGQERQGRIEAVGWKVLSRRWGQTTSLDLEPRFGWVLDALNFQSSTQVREVPGQPSQRRLQQEAGGMGSLTSGGRSGLGHRGGQQRQRHREGLDRGGGGPAGFSGEGGGCIGGPEAFQEFASGGTLGQVGWRPADGLAVERAQDESECGGDAVGGCTLFAKLQTLTKIKEITGDSEGFAGARETGIVLFGSQGRQRQLLGGLGAREVHQASEGEPRLHAREPLGIVHLDVRAGEGTSQPPRRADGQVEQLHVLRWKEAEGVLLLHQRGGDGGSHFEGLLEPVGNLRQDGLGTRLLEAEVGQRQGDGVQVGDRSGVSTRALRPLRTGSSGLCGKARAELEVGLCRVLCWTSVPAYSRHAEGGYFSGLRLCGDRAWADQAGQSSVEDDGATQR